MKCKTCGFHKRGKNHEEGEHHKGQFGLTDNKKIDAFKKRVGK